MYFTRLYCYIVVTVQFEEDKYSFDEGDGSATICLVLNGVVQDTISVEILVESNTNEQGIICYNLKCI